MAADLLGAPCSTCRVAAGIDRPPAYCAASAPNCCHAAARPRAEARAPGEDLALPAGITTTSGLLTISDRLTSTSGTAGSCHCAHPPCTQNVWHAGVSTMAQEVSASAGAGSRVGGSGSRAGGGPGGGGRRKTSRGPEAVVLKESRQEVEARLARMVWAVAGAEPMDESVDEWAAAPYEDHGQVTRIIDARRRRKAAAALRTGLNADVSLEALLAAAPNGSDWVAMLSISGRSHATRFTRSFRKMMAAYCEATGEDPLPQRAPMLPCSDSEAEASSEEPHLSQGRIWAASSAPLVADDPG